MTSTPSAVPQGAVGCDTGSNVTRSLLGYGVLAGPFYVVASLIEATTRSGFDLTRHSWSLLENGGPGWIHRLVLALTGLMVIAAAVGLWRVLRGGAGARAVPILVGGYGAGMVAAGIFTADPADGFPIGTPAGRPTGVSWHAMVHLVAGGLGFASLIAACLVTAALHRRQGARGKAWIDTAVGILFGLAFLGIATGSTSPLIVLGFTAGIVISFGWLTWLALELTGFRAGNRRD